MSLFFFLLSSIDTLVTVCYVEEEVFFMMFLVKLTHRCTCGGDDIVHKKEQGIFRSEMNSLPNKEVKLSNYGR